MADLRDAALRVIDDILSQNKNLTLQMLLKLTVELTIRTRAMARQHQRSLGRVEMANPKQC